MAAFGLLTKTNGSYVVRGESDITTGNLLDYSSSDWSAEIAFKFDAVDYLGDYGEFFRNGVSACAFASNKKGWTFSTDSTGYSVGTTPLLKATLSDGAGKILTPSAYIPFGLVHAVMTYENSSDTFRFYLNDSLESETIGHGFVLPGVMGNLTIGANNKVSDSYTPGPGGIAMPDFQCYFARVWGDELQASDVSDIYNAWTTDGSIFTPGALTPKVQYEFRTEVSDASGTPGVGWIEDNVGSSHAKIIDHDSAISSPLCFITVPAGTIACVSPADASTGVSGATYLQAEGTIGAGNAVLYSFEIDEVATFNGAELKQSGWQVSDPFWKPILEPSTLYYWRCKVKNSDATESSWSTTRSFTTRAALNWFVRPVATVGTYGAEDGTSYANAFNDLRRNAGQGGQTLAAFLAATSGEEMAPDDTVWVCDDHGKFEGASFIQSTSPQGRRIHATGFNDTVPVNFRFDHVTYPARVVNWHRYSGAVVWTSEGGGVFSTPTYFAFTQALVMDDGSGFPDVDIDDPDDDKLMYEDTGQTLVAPGWYINGGKLYVRNSTDTSPANLLWYLVPDLGFFINVHTPYVHIVGGEFYGTNVPAPSGVTNLHLENAKFKHCPGFATVNISDFCDDWQITNCEISYTKNGVYGVNTGDPSTRRTGDRCTITNSYIHHIGVTGWVDGDSHAIGCQSANGWIIEDNYLSLCGSAIEFWTSNTKEQRDIEIRGNVIWQVSERSVTFGAGITFSNGNSTLGLRTGNIIEDNVIIDCGGSGMHISLDEAVTITGNLIIMVGTTSPDYTRFGIKLGVDTVAGTVTDNIIIDPLERFIWLGGDGVLTSLVCDDNIFWDDVDTASTALKFKANGAYTAFTSFTDWVANTPLDQNSQFANPVGATLPTGFRAYYRDFFVTPSTEATWGDANNDGNVNSADQVLLDVEYSPAAANAALQRILTANLNDMATISCLNPRILVDDLLPPGTYSIVGTPAHDGTNPQPITGTFTVAQCLESDGNGSVVYSSAVIGAGVTQLTIKAVVQTTSEVGIQYIAGNPSWYLYLDEGKPAMYVSDDGTAGGSMVQRADQSVANGANRLVAATFNNGTITISVDGAPVSSVTIVDNNPLIAHNYLGQFYVASDEDGNHGFVGCMKQVLVNTLFKTAFYAPFNGNYIDNVSNEEGTPQGNIELSGVGGYPTDLLAHWVFSDPSFTDTASVFDVPTPELASNIYTLTSSTTPPAVGAIKTRRSALLDDSATNMLFINGAMSLDDFTIFFVFTRDQPPTNATVALMGDANFYLGTTTNGDYFIRWGAPVVTVTNNPFQDRQLLSDEPRILIVRRTGTLTEWFENGVLFYTQNYAGTWLPTRLGGRTSTGDSHEGRIGEAGVLDRAVTDNEQIALAATLADRWRAQVATPATKLGGLIYWPGNGGTTLSGGTSEIIARVADLTYTWGGVDAYDYCFMSYLQKIPWEVDVDADFATIKANTSSMQTFVTLRHDLYQVSNFSDNTSLHPGLAWWAGTLPSATMSSVPKDGYLMTTAIAQIEAAGYTHVALNKAHMLSVESAGNPYLFSLNEGTMEYQVNINQQNVGSEAWNNLFSAYALRVGETLANLDGYFITTVKAQHYEAGFSNPYDLSKWLRGIENVGWDLATNAGGATGRWAGTYEAYNELSESAYGLVVGTNRTARLIKAGTSKQVMWSPTNGEVQTWRDTGFRSAFTTSWVAANGGTTQDALDWWEAEMLAMAEEMDIIVFPADNNALDFSPLWADKMRSFNWIEHPVKPQVIT